jgi:hypothetical protein
VSNNTVCALITKDQGDQKEEVNKLLSLEKDKFEEETQLSEEENDYQNEYNKLFGEDQEIESIVLYKKKLKIYTKKICLKNLTEKSF